MALASAVLDAADLAQLQSFMDVLRPALGQTARTFKTMNDVNTTYTTYIAPILAKLQATDTIDCPTGLAGAQQMPVSDIQSMMTNIGNALVGFYAQSNQQAYIKFAGLANVL